jgi:hypothetical protein
MIMICVVASTTIVAEPDRRLETARTQAQQCVDAIVKKNYEKVAELTHAKIIALLGGRAKMIELTRRKVEKLESDGIKRLSGRAVLPATIERSGKTLYCLIPVTYRVDTGEAKVLVKSPFLGVSIDDGKSWKFLDTEVGEEKLRKLLPEIPRNLKFPAEVEPVVEPSHR